MTFHSHFEADSLKGHYLVYLEKYQSLGSSGNRDLTIFPGSSSILSHLANDMGLRMGERQVWFDLPVLV